ncbi:MAG TPA: hypothetical protein ENJ20_03745, partial [Bacteroidetes bacterium]|nr:hypothetical protein [Bacteroidota bacterium]
MNAWSDWIYQVMGIGHSLQYKLMATLVVGIIIFFLRKIVLHLLLQNIEDIKTKYNWSKTVSYFSYFLTLL